MTVYTVVIKKDKNTLRQFDLMSTVEAEAYRQAEAIVREDYCNWSIVSVSHKLYVVAD